MFRTFGTHADFFLSPSYQCGTKCHFPFGTFSCNPCTFSPNFHQINIFLSKFLAPMRTFSYRLLLPSILPLATHFPHPNPIFNLHELIFFYSIFANLPNVTNVNVICAMYRCKCRCKCKSFTVNVNTNILM